MKKLSEVLKEHNDSKQMINAIIHYLEGTESIEDIMLITKENEPDMASIFAVSGRESEREEEEDETET